MNLKIYIENTKTLVSAYWEATLQQRLVGGAGSCYDQFEKPEDLESALITADWQETSHEAVASSCRVFRANLPGGFGLIKVTDLPNGTEFTVDDRKSTGKVSLTIKGCKGNIVPFTYLILGEEQEKMIVYTFHPGEPIAPSKIETKDYPHGSKIIKEKALQLGFEWAKIV